MSAHFRIKNSKEIPKWRASFYSNSLGHNNPTKSYIGEFFF